MVGAILGTIITTLAGSLLWKMALILGIVAIIAWLARRIIKGKGDGEPRQPNEIMALIVLIAMAGAAAGLGYGALDRANESVAHANALNAVQAHNQALAADLSAANERAETLRLAAERNRKLADAAERRAESIDRRLTASQRARADTTRRISRSAENVSKNTDGTVPVVNPDWVRDYNAALGLNLPTSATPTGQPGSPTAAPDPAGTGAVRESATGSGTQPVETGLLAPEQSVTVADVLVTHTINAEAALDAAERLTELQEWYSALRAERNRTVTDETDEMEPDE